MRHLFDNIRFWFLEHVVWPIQGTPCVALVEVLQDFFDGVLSVDLLYTPTVRYRWIATVMAYTLKALSRRGYHTVHRIVSPERAAVLILAYVEFRSVRAEQADIAANGA